MRVSLGTVVDLSAARADALRSAAPSDAPVFSVPEEDAPAPAAKRAHARRDERERPRARGEDDRDERPGLAASWAAATLAPRPPAPAPHDPATPARPAGKASPADAVGDARPGLKAARSAPAAAAKATPDRAAPAEAVAAPDAVAPSPAAPDAAASARSKEPAPDAAAPRDRPVAAPDPAAPAPPPVALDPAAAAPKEALAAAVESTARAAAQVTVQQLVVPAGAPTVQGPLAPTSASPAGAPTPLAERAKEPGPTDAVTALPTAAGAMPATTQRLSDNGLTPVNATASADDPLRARLQDALTSSIHQRTLQQAASGEVVVPGLGRVAVSARADDTSVAVEVHAAQAETARALHASAGAIAADVLAADIPLSTLSFTGAGTWSRPDGNAPGGDRPEAHARRDAPADAASSATPARAPTAPRGRVRIVL